MSMMTVCETATNYMHMLFLTDYRLIFQVDIERPLDLSRQFSIPVRLSIITRRIYLAPMVSKLFN